MAIRRLVMRDWDCEANRVVMAVQRSNVISLLATWARISIDREFRRWLRTCWSFDIHCAYRGLGFVAVVLSASCYCTVFGGAASDPSRRPVTCAPRRPGMTCAFHRMKLVLVSFSDGRAPRLSEMVDEDDMERLMARVIEEGGCWLDRWEEDDSIYHIRWKRSYSLVREPRCLY